MMYPFLRFAWIMFRARRKPKISPGDPCEMRLTAWPWDCDMFLELNNGRTLTLFDLGRFELGVRSGLIDVLKRRGWALTVAGSSLHYRKRILPFQRFTLRTQLVARDERWFYIVQTAYVGETPCSQGLLRTAIIDRKTGIVPTAEVARELGQETWRPEPPDWVAAWVEAERKRPWPPEPADPRSP